MDREIVTDPLGVEDLWSDLRQTLSSLAENQVSEVLLLFGFSWGRFVYEGPWKEVPLPVHKVEPMVVDCERKGFGRLGDDNLYLTVPSLGLRLHYSHESDIHLSYTDSRHGGWVDALVERWVGNGWLTEAQPR